MVDRVPQNYGENLWLPGALSGAGVGAPMTAEGAVFRGWVEQVLGPTLKPGDIVMLDKLAVHQAAGTAGAIAARGARLEPLPPYSPDFNPIEQCWAKLKTGLRQTRTRRCAGLVHSL